MPRPLGHIRIMLSARVIFDLEHADKIFKDEGPAAYADYMRGRGKYKRAHKPELGGRRLKPGAMWNFVEMCNEINKVYPDTIELAVLCKDTAETALPIFRNLDHSGLDVPVRIVNAGRALDKDNLKSFEFDLFLSRNGQDVQFATDNGIAAAVVNPHPHGTHYKRTVEAALRLCFDGDAVTFGSSAEVSYRKLGLDGYRRSEFNKFARPIAPGPFTKLLVKMSQFNKQLPKDSKKPFLLSLLTARGADASARALTVVEKLGVDFNDGMVFASGASKADILKSRKPDLFLDDQMTHLEHSSKYCPTALVHYPTGSPMHKFLQKSAKASSAAKAPKV